MTSLGGEITELRAISETHELIEALSSTRNELRRHAIEYAKSPHPVLRTRYNFGLTKFENKFARALAVTADKRLIENIGEIHRRMTVIEMDVISGASGDRNSDLEKLIGDEYLVLTQNFSHFVDQNMYAIREKEQAEFSRVVKISSILRSVESDLNHYYPIIIVAILFFSILIMLVSYLVSRSISRSIQNLSLTAESLAAGHTDTRVDPDMLTHRDEIGDFARAFDAMNRSLTTEQLRLRLIADSLPVLIFEFDTEYRFKFANQAYLDWHKLTGGTIIGRRIDEIIGQDAADKVMPFVARGLANERVKIELNIEFRGAGRRDIEATYIPNVNDQGTVVGCFVLVIDLTERKLADAKLQQAQKMEAVGQLTGGVAHDFNNLLAATMNYATLLALKLKGQDDLLALANSIVNAVERGTELTHRLLAFSRKQTLQPRSIQLGALCEGLTDLLKRTLGETIEVILTSDDENWDVHTDPSQVESALLNLAINASHAMPKGGRLVITVENASVVSGEYSKRWEGLPGDYVALRVADTGTGMPAHVLDHAFEPFFTTKEVGQGSGLGLSMVYGFAQQSGGFATIDSTEGHGTTVTIYLPRADPAQAVANTVATDTERPEGRGETILLVEDDSAVRDSTKILLEMLGYTVLTAEDGTSAVKFLSNTEPLDLLLSDLVLPGDMNGFDLYEKVQQQRPDLKCLFISGHAPLPDRRLPEGTLLLSKPIALDELAGKLRTVLDA